MFANYTALALYHGYRPPVNVIASLDFADCTFVMFLHVTSLIPTNNFQSDSRLYLDGLYLVALFSFVTELLEVMGVYSLVDGTRFNTAILLLALTAIKRMERTFDPFFLTYHVLSFNMQTGPVSVLLNEGSALVVQSGKNVFVPQPRLLKVPFLIVLPSWCAMRQQADEYMHRQHLVFMPPYDSDFFVFVFPTSATRPSPTERLSAKVLAFTAPKTIPLLVRLLSLLLLQTCRLQKH